MEMNAEYPIKAGNGIYKNHEKTEGENWAENCKCQCRRMKQLEMDDRADWAIFRQKKENKTGWKQNLAYGEIAESYNYS